MICFCESLNSNIAYIKEFVQRAIESIRPYIKDDATLFDFKVILNELLVNGIIHGNGECLDKYVKLSICFDGKSIFIKVSDEGEGVNRNCKDPRELRCNGRGLLIVEALTDKLLIEGNHITVLKIL